MNKADQLAKNLNRMILQSNEYKSYAKSLKAIKEHPEILELEKELKDLQKKLLHLRTQKEVDTKQEMAIYQQKRGLFENHPLVVNYLSDKEDLESLCRFIGEAITGGINEKC